MSYTIPSPNAFYAQVKQVVDSQTDSAITALTEEQDVHQAVHDARKSCKKVRAAWRLIRDDLGEKGYKKRNVWFRDTARLLSDMRDATAVIEALELLRSHFGEVVYKSAFDQAGDAFEEKRRRYEAPQKEMRPEPVNEALERLLQAKEKINDFVLRDEGWEGVIHSIRRVYKRGYKALEKAQSNPSVETIHEWRKRTKYLFYQLRLLKKVWPSYFHTWWEELHGLSDLQGDHHDMAELKTHLDQLDDVSPKIIQTLKAIATQLQEQLYVQAIPLGKKLYAEKPDAFARRMQQYLTTWDEQLEEATKGNVKFTGSEGH